MLLHRQMLKFVEVEKTPLDPGRAGYLPRGSVQYEFGSELLQMPIHLLRITNAEAQVPQELSTDWIITLARTGMSLNGVNVSFS